MKKILFTLTIISFLFTFRMASSAVSESDSSSSASSSATTHKVPEPGTLLLITGGLLLMRRGVK